MTNRPRPATITLGDSNFTIRPLTCQQLQLVDPIIEASAETQGKLSISQALSILDVALKRDHADIDLMQIEATPSDIYTATTSVLSLISGTSPTTEASTGEVPAAAGDSASTGQALTLG